MVSSECSWCSECSGCSWCSGCSGCSECSGCSWCYDCENLVNGFCCSKVKLAKKDKSRYWIFNNEVTKEEWDERFGLEVIEKEEVCSKCGQPLKDK